MYISGGLDSRSAVEPIARDSTSMPPDHPSTALWDRQVLNRDKADRIDRDKLPSTKDWASDNRSFTRSSNTLLSNGSFAGPANKRRALGRTGTSFENGRYAGTVGRSPDSTGHVRAPAENGKTDRDLCGGYGGPSPGYSGSPVSERPVKDKDSFRPDSHPWLHNGAEGCGSRERERSKLASLPYSWEPSHRERYSRDKAWGRPDSYKRTCALPKLDSPRDWSVGDRDLLEGRVDRYGNASLREAALPDALHASTKEHSRFDWRSRDRSVFSGPAVRSASEDTFQLKDVGPLSVHFEAPRAVSPPKPLTLQSAQDGCCEDSGLMSPRKRPRLTWGQGLAKYEKEKTEEEPSAHKKAEEKCCQESAQQDSKGVPSPCDDDNRSTQNQSNFEQHPCKPGLVQKNNGDTEIGGESLAASVQSGVSLEGVVASTSMASHVNAALLSPNMHAVKVFLESYYTMKPVVPKHVLTQHVEKVEFEIELLEKEIASLYGTQKECNMSRLETQSLGEDQVTHADNALANGSPLTVSALVLPSQNMDSSICFEKPTDTISEFSLCKGPETAEPGHKQAYDRDTLVQEPGSRVLQDVVTGMVDDELNEQSKASKNEQRNDELENGQDIVLAILHSNRKMVEQSLMSLEHLNYAATSTIHQTGRLYGSPDQAGCWKLNVEAFVKRRKRLELKVAEKRDMTTLSKKVLALKYRLQRELWQRKQADYGGLEAEKTVQVQVKGDREEMRPAQLSLITQFSTGLAALDAQHEGDEVGEKHQNVFFAGIERGYLKMPVMQSEKKEMAFHMFQSKNGLVEDPIAAEQERKVFNPWSGQERKIFLDKYSVLGKDFRKISSFLEHKTVADCVEFYYRNQKMEEFKKVHRRHQLKRRREYRSSTLFLANTPAVTGRADYGGNSVSMEGLSLVAAAAAAMSAPRVYPRAPRGLATPSCKKICPTRTYQPGKVLNDEKPGGKGVRSRASKGHAPSVEIDASWSDNERDLFANALVRFGKDFHIVSQHIGSKSEWQCKVFFSKARKRLGLDRLVEHHKAMTQALVGDNGPSLDEPVDPPLENGIAKPMVCVGDLSGLQKLEENVQPLSGVCADGRGSDVVSEVSPGNPNCDDAFVNDSKTVLEADRLLPDTSAVCLLDNRVRQELVGILANDQKQLSVGGDMDARVACDPPGLNGGAVGASVQHHCSTEQSVIFGETLQLKTEPVKMKMGPILPTHLMSGIFSAAPFSYTPSKTGLVSANSPPVAAVPHIKEPCIKAVENTKIRREPTSWTQDEKEKFADVLRVHGKNWDRLRECLPGKSLTQIKTYFQNSKAKLGFGLEVTANSHGRGCSMRKRRADDSDSSSNAGSAGQNLPRVPMYSDSGGFKVSPSLVVPSTGLGSSAPSTDALVYANLLARNSLEDTFSAQKVLHSMGLSSNVSTPGIHPLFNPSTFTSANIRGSQQSYVHTSMGKSQQVVNLPQPQQGLPPLVVVQPSLQQQVTSAGIHQMHPLPPPSMAAVRMLQDSNPPSVQLHKQPALQQNEALLQQQQLLQQLQPQVLLDTVLQHQLLPQLIQRQQQNQMAGHQVPYTCQQVLGQHQAHLIPQTSMPMASHLQQASSANSQLVSASQPFSTLLQIQQHHPELLQSRIYQMHAKSQSLQQQHHLQTPQLQQLQLLQLHWQQQAQMQQSQVKQVQSQLPHLQQHFTLINEQQQQLSVLRGILQGANGCIDAVKPGEINLLNIAKSQGACDLSGKVEADMEGQSRASDIKLFGQSLLSQPGSGSQLQTSKPLSSLSPQGAFPAPSSSSITGKNTAASLNLQDGVNQSAAKSTFVGGLGDGEPEQSSVQVAVARINERLRRGARFLDDGRGSDAMDSYAQAVWMPESSALSDASSLGSDVIRAESESTRSEPACDGGATDRGRMQEQLPILAGGQAASQGLPRVLDALVALAEWRLQNAHCGSEKITDEFLSQSWEALKRDPGSLVEAGKAGGSLAQIYTCNGGEALQQLRGSLLSSQSQNHLSTNAGNVQGGVLHSNDAPNAVVPTGFQNGSGRANEPRARQAGDACGSEVAGS